VNKLKPYLFWIVCGVIVLVELVLLVFIVPTGKGDRDPGAVKQDLDAKSKDLEALYQKAKAGAPSRTFDTEVDKDIEDLTSKWLATPAWNTVLEPHLAEYSSQIGKIRDYLVARSQQIHKPISSEHGKFEWYSQYETATAELLQKLYVNQCLLLPKAASTAATPGPQQGNGPVPQGSVPGDSPEADAAPDFKKATGVRTVAGFLTTTQYPDSDRFEELTTQFRVMELVASALIDSKGTNEPSPVVPMFTPSEAHAQLQATSWKDATEEAVTVQLTLQGPLSAVLAAEAALEENRDDTLPVKLVSGVSLVRKNFLSGDRKDISSEPVVLRVTLAVLDFTKMKEPEVVIEKPKAPPPPPRPKKAPAAAADKSGEGE
jgi:hypothetical protein